MNQKQKQELLRKKRRKRRQGIIFRSSILILGALSVIGLSVFGVQKVIAWVNPPEVKEVKKVDKELQKILKNKNTPQEWKNFLSQYPQAKQLYKNRNDVPDDLLQAAFLNPEMIDFAAGYKTGNQKPDGINIHKEMQMQRIPQFYQWDKRWGYAEYGDGMLGITGCGPTALAMVASGLTRDESFNPYMVAQFAESSGYYTMGIGSAWALMDEGASALGLYSETIPLNENIMKQELDMRHVLIASMSPGDFTNSGHFIVITGYDKKGNFIVQDPNRKENTDKTWSYERIQTQISSIWSLSLPQ